jgi:uncharacterized integral membrane protein
MIQNIILSPILIFLMFFVVLLMVTRWANSRREMPAYILGWMIGIFAIIIYQSLVGDSTPTESELIENAIDDKGQLNLAALLIPSALGLVAGLGASAVYAYVVRTHARRSIAVAIITSSLILTLFLIVTVTDHEARVFGVFALAFGIGVLGTFVVGGGASPVARDRDNMLQVRTRSDNFRPDDFRPEMPSSLADDALVPRPPDNFQPLPNRPPTESDLPVDGAEVSRSRLDDIRSRFD